MRSIINSLPSDYREMLNVGILNKSADRPIEEFIFDAFKGFEIIPEIKILGYEWDPCEENYDANDHIVRRNANKTKVIKSIAETRCGVMYLHIEIKGHDKQGNYYVRYMTKPLIIPIEDENGYFLIKGKKCYLIYQLVDKMLYPSFGAVTVKSLMPICVKTSKDEFTDTAGNVHTIPTYTIQIFRSAINVLLIYSHLCINKTLQFMEVSQFIHIEKKREGEEFQTNDRVIYFDCGKRSDCVIGVLRKAFEKEVYVRSIVGCLIKLFQENKVQYTDLNDWDYWMIITGGRGTVSRGVYQHIFFNRLLDEVSRKELPINEFDKQDIYHLLRWIIQNYQALWAKDNLSMLNKRLRCHEYISTFITAEVSKRINRIVGLGDKVTISDLQKIFKFPEDIFITRLYSSGVLRYVEQDSDIDFPSKVQFTSKGPNSLGVKDTRRIPIRQRLLHPTMLGRIAIDEVGQSDPGRSGSISPYIEMDSLFFDDSLYENALHYRLSKLIDEVDGDEYESIEFDCNTEDEYNAALDALFRLGEGKVRMFGVTNHQYKIIVEKDPREGYRKFNEEAYLGGGEQEESV